MGLFSKKKIHVVFIDSDTGKAFGQSEEVPIEQLPDSFAIQTTMHLGSDDWRVIEAEPVEKSEFKKTGKLTLRMQKVQTMDPKKILFSLATISDDMPNFNKITEVTERDLVIHDDDWRMLEAIPTQKKQILLDEFAAINEIHENHRVGSGFNKLHVRKFSSPLQGFGIKIPTGITQNPRVNVAFSFDKKYAVLNGFAFNISESFWVYGVAENEELQVLAVWYKSMELPPREELLGLGNFCKNHNLWLVDWLRLQILSPETFEFVPYSI